MISTQVNPGTVGRHRASATRDQTRARFGLRAVCALFTRRRRAATIPAAYDADSTEILAAVGDLMPPLEDRIAMIEQNAGVHVTIDPHFVPGECGRCETERPNITCIRIYAVDPHPAVIRPLGGPDGVIDTCFWCGIGSNGAVALALSQARTVDRDLWIEVCE
ncbi:hypothetical protein GCM10027258_63140 [Amycolatopsis stemonae]